MLSESETAFIFLILSIIHLNRNCAASHYRKIVGGCLSGCQGNSARFSVCCLNMAVGQGFYYNLIKFHSNHKNIFLERKNEKKKGFMYYCFPFQQSQWFQPFLHLALLFFSMSSFFMWIIGDILKPTGVENYKLKKTSFSTDVTESEGIPVTVFFPELSK